MRGRVEREIQTILADAPKDWHGGLEATDKAPYRPACEHVHVTLYFERVFCRDCGRWWSAVPA